MKNILGKLRWFVILGSASLLAACGGPAGPDGPRPLTDSDYILMLTTTLQAAEFDELSTVWVSAVGSIEDRQRQNRWVGGKRVDAAGVGVFEVDARDLLAESGSLDPLDVVGTITGHWDTEVRVSDATASFNLLVVGYVYQADGAGNVGMIASHSLSFPASYEIEGTTWDRNGYAVFSDKALSITAAEYTVDGVSYEVDAEFRAGWNVVYWSHDTTADWKLVAQPLLTNTEFRLQARTMTFAYGQDPEVYGYSVVAEHTLSEDPTPYVFAFYSSGPVASLYTRAWAGFHVTANRLVPFSDAYPGLFTTTGVTVDPPEARGMVAAVYVFDQANVGDAGWAADLYSALGGAVFTNGDGQDVWFMYSDRSATITVDVVDAASAPIRTVAEGAPMTVGWNRFDLVPDGVGGYVLTKVPLAAADWSFVR